MTLPVCPDTRRLQVIRFSAALVVVAVVVLIGGIAASALALVYVAIVLSAVALVMLAIGVVLKKDEILGDSSQQVNGAAGAAAGQPAMGGQSAYGQSGFGQPGYGQNPPYPDYYRQNQPRQDRSPSPAYGTQWQPSAPPPAAQTRVDLTAIRTDQAGAGRGQSAGQSQPAGQGQSAGPDETRLDLGEIRADLTRTDLTRADLKLPPATPAPSREPATSIDELRALRDDRPPAPAAPARPGETAFSGTAFTGTGTARDDSPRPGSARDVGASSADAISADAISADAVGADDMAGTATEMADDTGTASDTGTAGDTLTTGASGEATAAGADDLMQTMAVPKVRAGDSAAGTGDREGTTGAAETGQRSVTVVPGVPRYHAANCILIRFMEEDDLQKMSLDEATAAGCSACRACQADTGSFRTAD
jgi:hypothetical protein